jgi:adenine deaminase
MLPTEIDAQGRYLIPGLMDGHTDIQSVMLHLLRGIELVK